MKRWGIALILLLLMDWAGEGFAQVTNQTPREQVLQLLQGVISTNQPAVIKSIQAMGTNAIPTLIEVLGYRQQAMDAWYEKVYLTTPATLQKHLSKPEFITKLRSEASFLLMLMPETKDYFQDLVPLLRDERAETRRSVASIFSMRGQNAPAAIQLELIPLLKDDDAMVREYAMVGLGQRINDLPRAKAALENAMQDQDERVRVRAGETLLRSDKNHPEAWAVVTASLKSTNEAVRLNAIGAYLIVRKNSPEVDREISPIVNGILSGTNSQMQAMTLMLLQGNGKVLTSTVPEVQKLLTNTNNFIQMEAGKALRVLTNNVPKL
ncbi:MAG TPA: HEAT repeat domain-containing protein [Verrucomicrobiae bacterium]